MSETIQLKNTELLDEVQRRSGTPVAACFQCHKCSTGCPIGPEMDYLSSQVMRLVQLGEEEEVLRSRDIAGVMDTLRMLAVERKVVIGEKRPEKFNRSFLESVRRHGRVFEFGMMAAYKLRSGDLLGDVGKFPKMLSKGKISLLPKRSGDARRIKLPKRSGDARRIKRIFRRAEQEDQKR